MWLPLVTAYTMTKPKDNFHAPNSEKPAKKKGSLKESFHVYSNSSEAHWAEPSWRVHV